MSKNLRCYELFAMFGLPQDLRVMILRLLYLGGTYFTTCQFCKQLTRIGQYDYLNSFREFEYNNFLQTNEIKYLWEVSDCENCKKKPSQEPTVIGTCLCGKFGPVPCGNCEAKECVFGKSRTVVSKRGNKHIEKINCKCVTKNTIPLCHKHIKCTCGHAFTWKKDEHGYYGKAVIVRKCQKCNKKRSHYRLTDQAIHALDSIYGLSST